jgi:hypothetical protein
MLVVNYIKFDPYSFDCFLFFKKKFIPLQLISFDFYIKFDPHSFDSYFFILFLIDFFFNFIPKHFVED